MKRILAALVILAAGIMAGLFALPRLYSGEALRAGLESRVYEITGRTIEFAGDPAIVFDPFLAVEIHDVVFRSPSQGPEASPLVSMPRLRARMSLAAILTGRVNFNEFQFVRPSFHLRVLEDGRTNWAFPEGNVWRILDEARRLKEETPTGQQVQLSALSSVDLGSLEVIDGVVNYENAISGRSEKITGFSGSLSWPNTRSAWRFEGRGIWRGDALQLNTTASQPVMLLAGAASGLTASIRSDPLNLTFNGEANRFSDLFFQGSIAVNSPSLRRVLNLFGGELAPGSSLAAFSGEAMLSGTFRQFKLDNATISLDGNSGTGAITYGQEAEGRHRLSGTMAYTRFDTRPYLISIEANNSRDAEGLTLLDLFGFVSADLRVSAGTVDLGAISVTDFAGSLLTKDGGMLLDIGNAGFQNGNAVGTLHARRRDGKMELNANLTVGPVSPAAISALDGISAIRPSGNGQVKMKLSATGNSKAELGASLGGEFRFSMAEGRLQGLNFQAIASSLATASQTPDVSQTDIPIGNESVSTEVRDLILQANINRGVGWIRDSSFVYGSLVAELNGKVDLRLGSLALWGSLGNRPNGEGQTVTIPQRRFFIGGTLGQPLFVPEAYSSFPGSVPSTPENEGTGDRTNPPQGNAN